VLSLSFIYTLYSLSLSLFSLYCCCCVQSQLRKLEKIKGLLVAGKGSEAQFIIRSLQGKMRIGLAESSALVALAHAINQVSVVHMEPDRASELLKEVHHEMPSLTAIVGVLQSALAAESVGERREEAEEEHKKEKDDAEADEDTGEDEGDERKHPLTILRETLQLTVGFPVKPMLAQPTKGISEVLDRLEGHEFTCEFKYDGERAQVHRLEDGSVQIFTRNLECYTSKYPDVIGR
jgi:DNA ligase 1